MYAFGKRAVFRKTSLSLLEGVSCGIDEVVSDWISSMVFSQTNFSTCRASEQALFCIHWVFFVILHASARFADEHFTTQTRAKRKPNAKTQLPLPSVGKWQVDMQTQVQKEWAGVANARSYNRKILSWIA